MKNLVIILMVVVMAAMAGCAALQFKDDALAEELACIAGRRAGYHLAGKYLMEAQKVAGLGTAFLQTMATGDLEAFTTALLEAVKSHDPLLEADLKSLARLVEIKPVEDPGEPPVPALGLGIAIRAVQCFEDGVMLAAMPGSRVDAEMFMIQ